ncbi:glycosyl transferase [Bradyrhizobium sp. SSBR45G]|uniref:glycosyltransferase family 4 protein n=1 Tax=unclassified Bradyrhizobium TaxID=2631580 RepID=UPI002342B57D|nr:MULTISPECIES: glycosyltransferase family 4 protein [unclassified Bradyrhizobium]GLH76750.1 glycosyl transferase [Bradyrhizobium sp. SSBR45G]GLH83508.1 glycosyl transferase [Bradyrhizobium sp. SSBR45R]
MKILIAHNRYQGRGGEDVVFEAETTLLREAGHQVETLTVSNDAINSLSSRVAATLSVVDSRFGRRVIGDALRCHQPDVVHVHNFFPRLSPAIFDVCRQFGVPAVATLHNYRTICSGGMLLRDGRICHDCLDAGNQIRGIVHRCYRNSLVGSAASACMITSHQRRGTWTRPGLRLIALTQFARDLFASSGFDAERIDVKPNFLPDPGEPDWMARREGILFVGRLSPEKGVHDLLRAAALANVPLRIAGDGPENDRLRREAGPNVKFLGEIPRVDVLREMSSARALVVPSRWYEGFPMVVVEAFARGTPVIASRLGALAEIIRDDETGAVVTPGDIAALAAKMTMLAGDDALVQRCGRAARQTYLNLYTPRVNLRQLEAIYRRAQASG